MYEYRKPSRNSEYRVPREEPQTAATKTINSYGVSTWQPHWLAKLMHFLWTTGGGFLLLAGSYR